MAKLSNPLKPDPLKVNPTVPIRPIGAPTGAAARLGMGQSPNISGPTTHAAPTKVPQQPTSQYMLQRKNPVQQMGTNMGMGVNSGSPVNWLDMVGKHSLFMPKTADEDRSKLPYRDRAEMYALKGNKIFGSLYADNDNFGVYGGGIDPGEDPLQAAAREFKEESGYSVKNPRHLPFEPNVLEWKGPFTTLQQVERAKQFRGSRTFYVAGDLGRKVPNAKIDEPGRRNQGLYELTEALRLSNAVKPSSETLAQANKRRAEILQHLIDTSSRPKTASELKLLQFTNILSSLAIRPIPTSIKMALRLR